ncbi:MAG: dienelactone hydrolase family protein [Phycisphaerales bacterium]
MLHALLVLCMLAAPGVDPAASAKALKDLRAALDKQAPGTLAEVQALAGQPFASVPLTRKDAEAASAALWKAYAAAARPAAQKELESGQVQAGGVAMPIWFATYGKAPPGGRSLFISMHGGGGAPKEVNDQQWENQKKLYKPDEGIYVAPRAPSNEWNLWHEGHIDPLFAQLVQDMVLAQGVNPDRVYIMGYSAGGDGVFQLAPRMADRWAAAAMMAGHPNETKPDGLRNLPFTLHMGGNDGAFKRNEVAAQWKTMLDDLEKTDPGAYPHWVQIHPGKGHWMDREDAAAVPWMAKFTRDSRPSKIVWLQDDVTEPRFYWLAVDDPKAGERMVVARDGQRVTVTEAPAGKRVRVRLDDTMAKLDEEVTVQQGQVVLWKGVPQRTIGAVARTLAERGDPKAVFVAEVEVVAGGGAVGGK